MFDIIINPQIQYLLLLQSFRESTHGLLDNFFMHITTLGENTILFALIAVIYWCINKKAGIFFIFSLAVSVVINLLIKLSFCINRPWILDSRVCPLEQALPQADGYSFPSGHTARAVAVWGAIAYWWKNNKAISLASIMIALLIGFSRNYIGVHTPQDVVVSIFLGIVIILALSKILSWAESQKNRDLILYFVAMFLGLLIYMFLYIKCSYQMLTYDATSGAINPLLMKHSEYGKLGFFFGAFTGWITEKRFINFDFSNINLKNKITIGTFGVIILISIPYITALFLKEMIPTQILSATTKFLCALFITLIYPTIIKFIVNR